MSGSNVPCESKSQRNKSKRMFFNQRLTLPDLKVTCRYAVMERVTVTKILRITVDRDMSFKTHSQQVCA